RVIERVLLGPLVSPDAVRLARELVAADPVSFPVAVAGAADPVPVRARVRVLVRELVAAVAVRDLPGASLDTDLLALRGGGAAPHAGDPGAVERVPPARLGHRAGPTERHQRRRGVTAPREKPVGVGAGTRGPVLPVEAGRALSL